MSLDGLFVMPPDIVIAPVHALAPKLRRQLEGEDDHFVVSRPRGRALSKVIDEDGLGLLECFRQETTIVDAVIEHSVGRQVDAERLLERAYPLLESLISGGILVPAEGTDAQGIEASLGAGASLDGGFVVERLVQLMDDTEVYRGRSPDGRRVALKVARDARPPVVAALRREARILAELDGVVSPALAGEHDAWIAVEWCPGRSAEAVASETRRLRDRDPALLEIVCAIADAYARLHAQGVVHGDVHAANVLVDGSHVRLIDFGLACRQDERDVPRGGVAFFFEPEYARSEERPPASRLGEQYSLAALLYYLVVGANYVDFSLERSRLFEQIREAPPLGFAHQGRTPWPALEAVLGRALSKAPAERYPDMAAFAAALAAVAPPALARAPAHASPAPFVDEWLLRMSPPEFSDELSAPTASITYGAAGIAYVYYRIACLRDDTRLLGYADHWALRAQRESPRPEAFESPEIDLSKELAHGPSIFHSSSGVDLVQALIGLAMCDYATAAEATQAFLTSAGRPSEELDVTLGKSSVLLGAATLLDALPEHASMVSPAAIEVFGDELASSLWSHWNQLPAIAESPIPQFLGVAHGWAGYMYALLRWCDTRGAEPPAGVRERLAQLAGLAQHQGERIRWSRKTRSGGHPADVHTSWCNGTAGMVHLWLRAHARYGDPEWLELARGAAIDAWQDRTAYPSLCCGLVGRAYAHLAMLQHTGETVWEERARVEVADAILALRDPIELPPRALFKGDAGVVLVAAELAYPELACLPLFQDERWPQATAGQVTARRGDDGPESTR